MPKDWDRTLTSKGFVIKEPLRSWFDFAKRRHTWYSIRYRAHDPTFENILWPSKWSKERLQGIRQGYIDIGNPEGYAQEYLNYPIDESSSYFRRQDFGPMADQDMNTIKKYYVGVDLAISAESKADYTVMVVGGVDQNDVLHIVEVTRERMDSKEIIDNLFFINKKYDPEMFAIEASMIEKSIGPFLRQEMARRGQYFSITTMVPTKDKETRARSIQGRMRAGGLRFNKEAEWYSELEQEMLQFPRSRHDDQVDALAWLGLIIDTMNTAPTLKELAEEDYEMQYQESGMYEQGRNPVTGY